MGENQRALEAKINGNFTMNANDKYVDVSMSSRPYYQVRNKKITVGFAYV